MDYEGKSPFNPELNRKRINLSNGARTMKHSGYLTVLIIIFLCTSVILGGCTSPASRPMAVTSSVPLAEYHRSGGIAGILEYLYIYENGTVISSKIRNGTIILNRSEINEIDDLLRKAPVLSQNADENTSRKIPDMIHLSVRYRGNTVKAPDSAMGKLQEILNRIPAP
jgi:hypothetical protein